MFSPEELKRILQESDVIKNVKRLNYLKMSIRQFCRENW